MPATLPPTPDLEHLRREAKALLAALRAGDPAAHARMHAVAPGLAIQLSTSQLIVAREHGCASWPQLKQLVERVTAHGVRYDTIGLGYSARRRPDPRIAAAIHDALGDARTVLNIGAGAGSYEPTDRPVLAVEPSVAMALQRPEHLPPAIQAMAESLPLADKSVDAALGVLTVHHWSDQPRGLAELRRVTRRRIVLLTIDPLAEASMWLFADYVPELVERDLQEFASPERLSSWIGAPVTVQPVPVPADCTDGFLLSFWSRPEAVLDPDARRATSGFARLDDTVEREAVARLAEDLRSGAWDERHGHLRELPELDVGLRLVVADLAAN